MHRQLSGENEGEDQGSDDDDARSAGRHAEVRMLWRSGEQRGEFPIMVSLQVAFSAVEHSESDAHERSYS